VLALQAAKHASSGEAPSPGRRAKGDREPQDWMPTYNWCKYVTHWVAVKYRWGLRVDRRELKFLASKLAGACGRKAVKVPAKAAVTGPVVTATAVPTVTASPSPTGTLAPIYSPPATTATTPSTSYGVTPGAFFAEHYAYGYTSAGTLMQCKPSATDTRFRWRAA